MAGVETAIMPYLDRALEVLTKFGIADRKGEESRLVTLLNDVQHVDEPKVLAIGRTVQYMGQFDDLVNENVGDMKMSDRYADISQKFDSIREDFKTMIAQLEDGKIDAKERFQNFITGIVRGSIHSRFGDIRELSNDVISDAFETNQREATILDAYKDFRLAVKQAEGVAFSVMKTQKTALENVQKAFNASSSAVTAYTGTDDEARSKLEFARDEKMRQFQDEERKYQLIKDVAETIKVSYQVGETLMTRFSQSHALKDQLYRRAVTSAGINGHIYSVLNAAYHQQKGMHEQTQTIEVMNDVIKKGIEDIATLSGKTTPAAVKAGYGAIVDVASMKLLVDSAVNEQEELTRLVTQYRKEATEVSEEIARIVNDGKERLRKAVNNYIAAPVPALGN